MSAATILAAWVSTHFTCLGARLFRNAVGMGWQGEHHAGTSGGQPVVILKNARLVPMGLITPGTDLTKAGKKKKTSGSSDYLGWTPVRVEGGYSEAQMRQAFLAGYEAHMRDPDRCRPSVFLDSTTPESPAQTLAVFTAVEEKTLAYSTLTPDQRNFLDQVHRAGGLAYVARETKDGPLLNRWPEKS